MVILGGIIVAVITAGSALVVGLINARNVRDANRVAANQAKREERQAAAAAMVEGGALQLTALKDTANLLVEDQLRVRHDLGITQAGLEACLKRDQIRSENELRWRRWAMANFPDVAPPELAEVP